MVAASSGRGSHRNQSNAIPIKSSDEIRLMREVCRKAALVLDEMAQHARPGMSTYDLDRFGKSVMDRLGVESACFGYPGSLKPFPCYTCISVGSEVVHGVASLHRILNEGEVISLDVVVRFRGYIGDNARSIVLGNADVQTQRLLAATKEALSVGIRNAVAGNRIGDISHSIQEHAEKSGFSVIREFVGHGVGKSMHEEPQIPNYGRKNTGAKILPGMTLAIEPMVNAGRKEVDILDDGWTVVTRDGLPSAHFEHTVLILSDGVEVLTTS
jgi:methionyl aminopeptidase